MFRVLTWAPFVAVLATGCIIYTDDTEGYDEGPPIVEPGEPGMEPDWDPGWSDDEGGFDTSDEDVVVETELRMDPATGTKGEVLIASILAEGDADLMLATSVEFLGRNAIEVLAIRERTPDELLVALTIPFDAFQESSDLLVRFEDGSGVFVADAFEIVPAPADTGVAP